MGVFWVKKTVPLVDEQGWLAVPLMGEWGWLAVPLVMNPVSWFQIKKQKPAGKTLPVWRKGTEFPPGRQSHKGREPYSMAAAMRAAREESSSGVIST